MLLRWSLAEAGARAIEVPEGSAAQQAQAILPESRVVGAFHNLSAEELLKPEARIDSDVIVCGDDAEAKVADHETGRGNRRRPSRGRRRPPQLSGTSNSSPRC